MSASYRKRLWSIIGQSPYNTMTNEECLATLNAKTETRIISKRANERDLLIMFATLNAGEAFIQKLETGAATNNILKRAMSWFAPSEEGIDIGNAKTRQMLDALVGSFDITQGEIDTVKAYAQESVSPAEIAGLATVCLGDIVMTREVYT